MEDKLISFETAKLAQEKGYPIYNNYARTKFYNRKTQYLVPFGWTGQQRPHHLYAAPSQSLLQRWLRENFNIIVTPKDCLINITDIDYQIEVYDVNNHRIVRHGNISDTRLKTYEEALELGLKVALELINNK